MSVTRIGLADVSLNVIEDGAGPPVLLLHGFPSSSRVWRHQVPALVEAGFRVVAPDLRGFGDSDRPADTDRYALPIVLRDVLALLDALSIDRAHIIAHDWGAALGWMLSALHPRRVGRFAALSGAHPHLYVKSGFDQREKAWYVLLFQFRGIAEQLLTRSNWQFFRDWARHHPESDAWIGDLSRPGALSAALNWYRANAGPEVLLIPPTPLPSVQAPTLAAWGSWDAYVSESQMLRSAEYVSGPWRYQRVEGATHWMQLDQPQRINRMLVEFLTTSTDRDAIRPPRRDDRALDAHRAARA
jgi:pimeloyl-ACP methyl ester carboxylesterase